MVRPWQARVWYPSTLLLLYDHRRLSRSVPLNLPNGRDRKSARGLPQDLLLLESEVIGSHNQVKSVHLALN